MQWRYCKYLPSTLHPTPYTYLTSIGHIVLQQSHCWGHFPCTLSCNQVSFRHPLDRWFCARLQYLHCYRTKSCCPEYIALSARVLPPLAKYLPCTPTPTPTTYLTSIGHVVVQPLLRPLSLYPVIWSSWFWALKGEICGHLIFKCFAVTWWGW